jgi:cytochrome c peroxidase
MKTSRRASGAARGVAVGLWLGLGACGGAPTGDWVWSLPDHFPEPVVPEDNPMSVAKVELGRRLFYDQRLSVDGSYACASCHLPERAFTDGRARAVGVTGEVHPRGAMAVVNVAWATTLGWANPTLRTLEDQALVPMFGEAPIELGLAGREAAVFGALGADLTYQRLFADVYPEAPEVSLGSVVKAIAAFERSLVSAGAPYDRWVMGDDAALSPAAKRGLELFNSERLECFHCHGGFNFADAVSGAHGRAVEAFHQTGLYDVDGEGRYPPENRGLAEITGRDADDGRFKAPSLRNVAVTGPYMHDGSIETLDGVLEHYAAGGRAGSARTSLLVFGFTLSTEERGDLKAFLEALTDEDFLTDPTHGPPR